eukprot:GEMP01050126.1.p1 GENE.GEMP01050126.1~~GEMP01050126.1.p1  ORF type:complete len:125 (+),score=28.33 GEMP01050126.1:131-505(+)
MTAVESLGCGLKEKIRELGRIIETDVISARAQITVLKATDRDAPLQAPGETVTAKGQIDLAKKQIIKDFEESKAQLSKYFLIQKGENDRLRVQIRQLKDDNCGMQQSMLALQRRLQDLEEEVGL